jgi:alkaline phosphatase
VAATRLRQLGNKNSKGEKLRIKNLELRNTSAKILRAGGVFLLVLVVCAWGFDYKLAVGDVNDLSFYTPAPSDWTTQPISGRDIQNIIFCIGDGMGINIIVQARQKAVGKSGKLWMERLPVTGLVRTYAASHAVTDSAAAATAMACGIKTKNEMLGMGSNGKSYASILEILSEKGWRTGLVATSTITHATPAGFACHVVYRGSEDEIAEQMLGNRVDVLFGGGRQSWLPKGIEGGIRTDKKNLIEAAGRMGYALIRSRQEMLDLKSGRALGLFEDDAMTTYVPEPMLSEMAGKAIGLLGAKSKDWFSPEPNFFLMVEGSQIDWAGHDKDTPNSLRQTLLFDMAVKEVLKFAEQNRKTLVIVTADHETGGLVFLQDKKSNRKVTGKWTTGDHSGADVALFAYGPGAEEFDGVMDNTDIPKKIAKLLKVSPFPREIQQAATVKLENKK